MDFQYGRILPSAPDFAAISSLKWTASQKLLVEAPTTSSIVGIIVESRRHHFLIPVLKEALSATSLPIIAIHGPDNRDCFRDPDLEHPIRTGRLVPIELLKGHLNSKSYNALMMSTFFWNEFRYFTHALVFQTDAGFCRRVGKKIARFAERFDYVGASWRNPRPVGHRIEGGCGGMSLRHIPTILQVLEKYNPAQWPGGEDGFFGLHVSLLGGKVAGPVAQSLFAVQDRLVFIPLGFHQPNRLSKPARFLLRYICPPSRRLL